jgi:hypothetical protein
MRNRCSFPTAALSDQIKSEVTGREHMYSTRSFIGASRIGGGGGIGFAGATGTTEGGGVSMAAGIARLPAAGPPGALEDGGGGTIAAGTTGLPGAGGGDGVTTVARATGLADAGSAGGIDGVDTFWRRAGSSAGFCTGGATLTSASGFRLGAVSLRRRFDWEAATRVASPFPGLVASCCVGWLADPPSRGTPRGSSRIHFTTPLPPSVRMKFFFSRRCKSVITHRSEKSV